MAEKNNFTSTTGGGTDPHVRFSGEIPDFTILSVAASEQIRRPEEINRLQQELGEMTLTISQKDAEIEQLRSRLTELESTQSAPTEVKAQVGSIALKSEGQSSASSDARITNNGSVQAKAPEKPSDIPRQAEVEIDLTPNPDLSLANQRRESIILYLLGKPNFEVVRPDASSFTKKETGIERSTEWANAKGKLEQLGILLSEKPTPTAKRSMALRLDMAALLAATEYSFVTPRVIEVVRSMADSAPSRHEGAIQEADLHRSEISNDGNGNGDHVRHEVSSRVRRMLADAPVSGPVYKERGKGAKKTRVGKSSFLVHRQERRSP